MSHSEIRLGRYQDKLLDIESIDTIITDAPYSFKTHSGSMKRSTLSTGDHIDYDHLTEEDCYEFVNFFAHKVTNFIVIFGDDITSVWWRDALRSVGLYVFAPVYYIKRNPMPRMSGDGPTSSGEVITRAATHQKLLEMTSESLAESLGEEDPRLISLNGDSVLTVARTRTKVKKNGSRPGHYLANTQTVDQVCAGQKDLETMCRIVSDYSSVGDLVVDPFAGYGTTLKACQMTKRNSIGSEVREIIYVQSRIRIKDKIQMSLV